MDKIAIYSRKSRFTGKGESIENQIELCKKYCQDHYGISNPEALLIYEDEGFSGGTLQRPQFQKLMEDARNGKFHTIVCYRLDRISRNIGDFAKLIEELSNLEIAFVSIKEQFDTSSPMGRAMMYIASVFSQLERETIAERIRDNMQELAKTGRWLGGVTPTGYRSKLVEKITVDGKKRGAYQLDTIPNEAELVRLIFHQFIEKNSLTKTETFLLQNQYKTKMGKEFTRFSIKGILQNPVYMKADEDAWNYFEKLGIEVYAEKSDFDGEHGIMAYNKTIHRPGKSIIWREPEEWIVSVGKHQGLVSGKDWLTVQNFLEQNSSKSYRKPISNTALLSGLLRCSCGGMMRPKLYRSDYEEGERRFSYLCERKEKSCRQLCDSKNPNGNVLDRAVCEEMKKLSKNSSEFVKQLESAKKQVTEQYLDVQRMVDNYRKEYSENEKKIEALLSALEQTEGTSVQYITKQIEQLHQKKEALQIQIDQWSSLTKEHALSEIEFDLLRDLLGSFSTAFDTMTIEQKRMALRNFIQKIVWDGENIHVYLFGSKEDTIDFSSEPICEDSK